MPPKKTTIVVGAGASAEAGLPTGPQLTNEIGRSLAFRYKHGQLTSGDRTIFLVLQHQSNIDQCFRAAERICKALPQITSIDEFIDNHRGDQEVERCGKLAIVRSILKAERSSKLYINPNNIYNVLNFSSIEDTWFNRFWQKLSKGCTADELKERLSSIVLIIFNYDRCLEHYLYHSIPNYYELRPEDAACLVNSIKIFHPYGTTGSLPWNGGRVHVEFGAEPTPDQLNMLASQTKTFTEGTDPDASDVEAIRSHVTDADTLVFLGFAYHPQNIDLLKSSRKITRTCSIGILGTAYGISDVDRHEIEQDITELCGGPCSFVVTTRASYRRRVRRERFEWPPEDCIPGSPWTGDSWRFCNRLRRTFGCGSIRRLSA